MEIENILSTNPSLISRKAEEAEGLRLTWLSKKEQYNLNEAKFILTLKATKSDLKSTEMKYYINNDVNLYNNRMDLVIFESNYRKKEVEVKALEEELRAAKMLARIKISEMGNLEGGIKWAGKMKNQGG